MSPTPCWARTSPPWWCSPPGASTTPEDLREHCANVLADYKVPRRIEVADELPRNATGKVLKNQLRDRLVESAPRS